MRLRIDGFKKEFQASIADLRFREALYSGAIDYEQESKPPPINVRSEMLDFNMVAILLHRMGFLQAQRSEIQEQQVTDMYRVLKLEKSQSVPALNLMNLLVVIMGLRDHEIETIDTPIGAFSGPGAIIGGTEKTYQREYDSPEFWLQSGHLDPDGSLKFSERAVFAIFKHFEHVRLNRRAQKREFASLYKYPAHVRSVSALSF